MCGIDIPAPELQITIHPPCIEDIGFMGEKNFFTAMQYICVDKEALIQDESLLATLTNFQVLMKVLDQSRDKQQKKNMVKTLFMMMFPNRQVMMLPSSIILSAENTQPVTIDDNNFSIFQDYTKEILCVSSIFQGDNIVYNPINDAAKKLADQMMRYRKKVASLKGEQDENKEQSILTRYLSILSVAGVISLDKGLKLTLFQLFDQIERFGAYLQWDMDARIKLAGGKPDKPVDDWMRDLYSSQSLSFTSEDTSSQIKLYK